jgi:hypothetical protein
VSNVTVGPRYDNRPLNDREQQLLQRLLSDPLSFPAEFKTWIVRSLEISDVALGMSNVVGLTKTLGLDAGETGAVGLLNTGCIVLFGGATLPPNSLLCNGALYNTSVYPELFKAIQYRHGGSGTSFAVPNMTGPVANTQYVIVT